MPAGVALLAALSACRGSAPAPSSLALDWTLAPRSPSVGPVTLDLTLTDAATHRPVDGAVLTVEGDMSHPGMTPVFGTVKPSGSGRYRAELTFTMGGDWILLVDAHSADGRSLHRELPVQGVRSR